MNRVFLYDGTFANLLSLIKYLIDNNIKPDNIYSKDYQSISLFDELIDLKINTKYIHLDKEILSIIYKVFLSVEVNKELIIYYFILNSFKYKDIILRINLKCVVRALNISKYVSRETHKFKGFTRFMDFNNFLYAKINPTNNVLPLLLNYFSNRLKNEYFIIEDVNRNILGIYNKKRYYLVDGNNYRVNIKKESDYITNLWQVFFKNISIKERTNLRNQMNLMPKKYWQYIIEMGDRYE